MKSTIISVIRVMKEKQASTFMFNLKSPKLCNILTKIFKSAVTVICAEVQ